MRLKILSCEVLARAIYYCAATSPHVVDVELLRRDLHDKPEALRAEIQQHIDNAAEAGYDAVGLGYGLCGNAAAGLVARGVCLAIPRAHDCTTLCLGSRARYQEEFTAHSGTYYYTVDYVERRSACDSLNPLDITSDARRKEIYEEYVQKYGKENADYLLEVMGGWMAHYDRAALIDMGVGNSLAVENLVREEAAAKGWVFEKLAGSLVLLRKLVHGDWDDDFLVLPPGGQLTVTYDENIYSDAREGMVSKVRTIRVLTASIVILVILLGAATRLGYGTLCSIGAWRISFTCPLGFLQMALASRNLLPQLWLSVALVLLSIVILGRFFCAWVCPAALLQDVFRGKGALNFNRGKQEGKKATIPLRAFYSSNPTGPLELSPKGTIWASYSRYAILSGALLSSLLFGFPVFCLVCPIGLFFGSLFAVSRLFSARQPSLELLLFPALLGLELFALKSWCRTICPLGALLSLMGALNRFLRPTVVRDKCFVSKGINCRTCEKVCPEEIDLLNRSAGSSLKGCTKCLECYEKCPVKAIKLAL